MKIYYRLLVMFATIATVACAGDGDKKSKVGEECSSANDMYFLAMDNSICNDEAAEFDTLSYAVGMNYGLLVQSLHLDTGYDRELFYDNFFTMLDAESVDLDALCEDVKYVEEFIRVCHTPYMQAKQNNALAKMFNPNAEVVEPVLFSEEFPKERVSQTMGRYFAGQIRQMPAQFNRYWVNVAFNDAYRLENMSMTDSIMQLSQMDLRRVLSNPEFHQELNDRLTVRCSEWLEGVSQHAEICKYQPDNGDAVYYRIDNPGNDIRPTKEYDSIYFDYTLYNSFGVVLESSEQMRELYGRYVERLMQDTLMSEEVRTRQIKEIINKLEVVDEGGAVLENLSNVVVAECVKNIGEGGSITIWMPASYVSEVARKSAFGNDGSVMSINLRRVAPQEGRALSKPMPISNIVPRKPMPSKNTVTKQSVK